MIYIVHGEDFVKSRNLILNQQNKLGVETRVEINIPESSPELLYEVVHSSSLFGDKQFVVLNISKTGRTNMEPYLKALEKSSKDTVIIIVSDKTLSQSNIFIKNTEKLNAKVVLNVKIPEGNTFRFVDSLFSKQRGKTYSELSKLISQDQDPFETFAMILYGLRNIAHAKFRSTTYSSMKDFVKSKSSTQASNFTEENIISIFHKLFELDKEAKTGGVDSSLMLTLAVEKVLNS